MIYEDGSFRDPAGKIYYKNNRIFRKLTAIGITRFLPLKENSIILRSIEKGFLIKTKEIENIDSEKNINLHFDFLKHPILSTNCLPIAFRTIYVLRKEELLLEHLIDSSSSESLVGRSVTRCPRPCFYN
jgi:hypothetical protein